MAAAAASDCCWDGGRRSFGCAGLGGKPALVQTSAGMAAHTRFTHTPATPTPHHSLCSTCRTRCLGEREVSTSILTLANVRAYVCAYVHMCVHACVRLSCMCACVRACVYCACVRACVCECARASIVRACKRACVCAPPHSHRKDLPVSARLKREVPNSGWPLVEAGPPASRPAAAAAAADGAAGAGGGAAAADLLLLLLLLLLQTPLQTGDNAVCWRVQTIEFICINSMLSSADGIVGGGGGIAGTAGMQAAASTGKSAVFCGTAGAAINDREALSEHYKSDLHR